MTKWIDTRKEYEITKDGQLIPTKVVQEIDHSKEFTKKDIIDITFRVVAALAILIPIIIFFAQKNNEVKRQKQQLRLEVYINASTLFHSMLSDDAKGSKYFEQKSKLYYENYPKVLLIGDSPIIKTFNELKEQLLLRETYHRLIGRLYSAEFTLKWEGWKLFDLFDSTNRKQILIDRITKMSKDIDDQWELLIQIVYDINDYKSREGIKIDSVGYFMAQMQDFIYKLQPSYFEYRDFYNIKNIERIKIAKNTNSAPKVFAAVDISFIIIKYDEYFFRSSALLINKLDSLIRENNSSVFK